MSYILDALRRAEHERHAGKAPGMESLTQIAATAAARVPPGIWVLAVLTLLLAATALVLALRHHRPPPAAPAPVATVVTPPAPASVVERPVLREEPAPNAQAAADHAAAANAIANGDALNSLDDVVDDEAAATPQAATVVRPANSTPAAAVKTATAALAPSADPTPATAPGAAQPAPAAAANTAAPNLVDMPDSYRSQFPQFTLDVHYYDADTARRWIMVAGQRYREGDSLPNGAHIAHIVDSGVVYDYGGQQVLVPNSR